MTSTKRVLLGMSGGLDSSVAAILLQKSGYTVIGATFRTWDSTSESCTSKNTGCCNLESIMEAKQFAEIHGIEHHIFDFREEFRENVIKDFVNEYAMGRTPNPCVICNFRIKWGKMLDKADMLDCDLIATGHYAGVKEFDSRYVLVNASDESKDQTYFLWMLTSDQLKRTLFPLNGFTKEQIRKIAIEHGFEQLSNKRESQEICFIPGNNYRQFIESEYPSLMAGSGQGDILDSEGNILGKHKGYTHYTIGQRKGIGYAAGKPIYVTAIDPTKNTITIGEKADLLTDTILVRDYHLSRFEKIPFEFTADVKIRYNTRRAKAVINQEGQWLRINFLEKVSASTPGQSAVFYSGDECLGGGIIV
jgi:tRNA-uridine 2-sulfurtransferase